MNQKKIINCKNCFHKWEYNNYDTNIQFCHICGFDNTKNKFDIDKLKIWIKNYYKKTMFKEFFNPELNNGLDQK